MDLGSFVVSPSIRVSPYCYSIFRMESYPSCEHGCVYCFGRWYRREELSRGWRGVVKSFERLLQRLKDANLKSVPFRPSTLVDPLQPREENIKLAGRSWSSALSTACR